MRKPLSLLPDQYLSEYRERQPFTLDKHVAKLKMKGSIVTEFPQNLAQSAVFSANIEGNPIDYDTYLKYQDLDLKPSNKPFQEIQDLLGAYQYAAGKTITLQRLLEIHQLSTATLLAGTYQSGEIRSKTVYVYRGAERIYTAVAAEQVFEMLEELIEEIDRLAAAELSLDECFYCASLLHLRFVHIHPFADGNGRIARLLEKWFLTRCLGETAWLIHSERYYFQHLQQYYTNINLGPNYENLDYEGCVPFLLMLPAALRYSYKG